MILLSTILSVCLLGYGDPHESIKTDNFIVHCDSEALQSTIGHHAEVYRRDIAVRWIGEPQKNWPYRHIIHSGYGQLHGLNENFFYLTHIINVYNIDDTQILYSTLPHEVAHSVLRVHCGLRLPLWASEGIAMMCERPEMGAVDNALLAQSVVNTSLESLFVRSTYPLLLSRLFYGQSYSVCMYLVGRSDEKAFLKFVQDGHINGWKQAVEKHYKTSMDELQQDWWEWHIDRFGVEEKFLEN